MRRGDAETRRVGESFPKNESAEIEKVEKESASLPNISASPRLRVSASPIDWSKVRRVLVARLRSIGDTVLATPSLVALKRFLPDAQIDILLEDWVAPVLEGFDAVDNVLTVSRGDVKSRFAAALKIRRNKYDVAINLHGGTTATFFIRASCAKYRVGFESYQYNFLYTHRAPSPLEFWQTEHAHSAEQQLALLGYVGIPVEDKPKSRLNVNPNFKFQISNYALIHPVAAFETKQWATENFARVAEHLSAKNLKIVAVATEKERAVLDDLKRSSRVPIHFFDDLTLPEITTLASGAKIFVGNDSGIAHIAAAVNTPSVVIFGASNFNHWRPWTTAPNEIVYANEPCSHQLDEIRKGSETPKCIRCVKVEAVCEAIEKVLRIEK